MSTFPTTTGRRRGYRVEQVEDFLQSARRAYDGDPSVGELGSERIRQTAFDMVKGGYQPTAVDAALERLENAFAERERVQAVQRRGERAWFSAARDTAQVIVDRLARGDGERFARTGILSLGYHRVDVDRFARRLSRYFEDGMPMSVDEVRSVVFRPQRGGYREGQVDHLLDSVIEVMLAVAQR